MWLPTQNTNVAPSIVHYNVGLSEFCSGIGCVGYWKVVAMGLVFNGTHNCVHHDAIHVAFARCDGNALIFTYCMQTFLSMQNFVLLQNFLS